MARESEIKMPTYRGIKSSGSETGPEPASHQCLYIVPSTWDYGNDVDADTITDEFCIATKLRSHLPQGLVDISSLCRRGEFGGWPVVRLITWSRTPPAARHATPTWRTLLHSKGGERFMALITGLLSHGGAVANKGGLDEHLCSQIDLG